jgi:uncharacterized protein (DUF305 family)
VGSTRFLGQVAVLLVLGVAACGGQSGGSDEAKPPSPELNEAQKQKSERAFLQAMVPHHQSAIDMAHVAESEGESSFVKNLARTITSAQAAEISEMGDIHKRLYGSPLRPDDRAHGALGLSAQEAGMNHMGGGMMLRGKRSFDRAFVDQMVPHHRGAIAMAEAVLKASRDPELRKLATEIITAQKREIREMNRFREREFGGPAPEADIPSPHAGHGG